MSAWLLRKTRRYIKNTLVAQGSLPWEDPIYFRKKLSGPTFPDRNETILTKLKDFELENLKATNQYNMKSYPTALCSPHYIAAVVLAAVCGKRMHLIIRSLSRFFNSIVADLNEKNGIPTGKKYWKLE